MAAEEESIPAKKGGSDSARPRTAKDWGAGKFIAAALVVGLVVGALGFYALAGTSGGMDEKKAKVFQLDAFHWGYSQETLEVNEGDLVMLVLRSAGSNHEMHELYEEAEEEWMEANDYDETEWEEEVDEDPTLKIHGFRLEAFGIEVEMPLDVPDDIVVVKFIADKTGTFTFRCSNDCGPGHDDMTGTLIVH
ncbi:MAG: hypothetical protein V3U09_06585 [Thermoplasmata archaeon]